MFIFSTKCSFSFTIHFFETIPHREFMISVFLVLYLQASPTLELNHNLIKLP